MQCPNTYDYTGNHIHLEKGFVKNLALVLAALLVLVVLCIVFMVVFTSLVPRLSLDDRNEARCLLYMCTCCNMSRKVGGASQGKFGWM